ncbi:hypothetical protein MNBD_GAMMA10-1971 [hydrothermal vent metagenome]|uniref:Uncharacterized protein n=1 Tax=hydrothermal vent metagenome TaxID=652676 RepID=A0A3B0Y427_9ZZZZ
MQNNHYRVIISKSRETPEQTTEQAMQMAAEQFAKLFNTSTEKAHKILQQEHFTIKKQLDKAGAEKFHNAISAIGINCRIEALQDEQDSALPEIEIIENNAPVKPLTDPAQASITALHKEPASLSLAAGPVEKATSETNNDRAIEDVDAENFCPECGTIRARSDSCCIHCGYDPGELKKNQLRSIAIKLLLGLTVLSIVGFLGWPWYQQYAKQQQIKDDLQLAFDTRNTISAFIQRTNFWPNQNIDAALPSQLSNRSIASIIVGENAVMTVTFKVEATRSSASSTPAQTTAQTPVQTLIFKARALKGRIVWNCLGGTLEAQYRPDICKKRIIEN